MFDQRVTGASGGLAHQNKRPEDLIEIGLREVSGSILAEEIYRISELDTARGVDKSEPHKRYIWYTF